MEINRAKLSITFNCYDIVRYKILRSLPQYIKKRKMLSSYNSLGNNLMFSFLFILCLTSSQYRKIESIHFVSMLNSLYDEHHEQKIFICFGYKELILLSIGHVNIW